MKPDWKPPQDQGIFLASRRDSRLEAVRWSQRINLIANRSQVILGLGAGLHVFELLKKTAEKILIIEPREWLVPDFLTLFAQQSDFEDKKSRVFIADEVDVYLLLKNIKYQVQCFQPAWGPRFDDFTRIKNKFNGREAATAADWVSIEPPPAREFVSVKHIVDNQTEVLLLKELIV